MIVKNVEKKEHSLVHFVVDASAEEFEAAVNSAYLKNKKSIAVPGFRKGKVPRKMIESIYGADVFYDDAINAIAAQAFEQGVSEKELKTVGTPSITKADVNDDKSLTMEFETAVYPEVTLGQYKGLEAVKPPVNITDEDVDKDLESTRSRNSRTVTVERPAKDGDTAVINFEGFDNGVPFDGGKGENFPLKLGSGSFVPGFEEQVVGMSAGEEKDIDITFPENYHPDLASKPVVFKVKVLEVKETQLPDLDDEFAKDVSEFDTIAEYRASIKEKLTENAESLAASEFKSNLMDKAIENMTADIPDAMIEDNLDGLMRDFERNVTSQGISVDEYLSMMGMDLATFRNNNRHNAVVGVQQEVLLQAIIDAEKIDCTAEEVEEEYNKISEQYKVDLAFAKERVSETVVRWNVNMTKAANVIYDSGIPVEKAPEAEKEAEAKTEEKPKRTRKTTAKKAEAAEGEAKTEEKPKRTRKTTAKKAEAAEGEAKTEEKPKRTRKTAAKKAEEPAAE